ncbi:MAG: hypothetical protein ACTS73_09160 [Arsenophonus sp. NEOnobi-MAG3]
MRFLLYFSPYHSDEEWVIIFVYFDMATSGCVMWLANKLAWKNKKTLTIAV